MYIKSLKNVISIWGSWSVGKYRLGLFFSNETIKGATETLEIVEIWISYSMNKALTQLLPRALFWMLRCHQHLLVYG